MDVAVVFWLGGAALIAVIAAILIWVAMSGNRGGGNRPD